MLLVQQDRRHKVTFSVDDDAPALCSGPLWIIRQSVARFVVSLPYAGPETLWVSHVDRPYVAPPGVGPLLYVALPLYPLFCMAEFISLCITYVVDITRKMSARYGTV